MSNYSPRPLRFGPDTSRASLRHLGRESVPSSDSPPPDRQPITAATGASFEAAVITPQGGQTLNAAPRRADETETSKLSVQFLSSSRMFVWRR